MKRGVSVARRSKSWRSGNLAATRYERCYPEARKSSRAEDIFMHIDYWHGDIGVDVKGNNLPDEIWVELKNVRGQPGWVFGEAAYIAFDMPECGGFVIVSREELKEYCRLHVDLSELVQKKDAYKRCYSRKDRDDLITKLVLEDLRTLPSYVVKPYCNSYRHPDNGDKMYVS